MRGIATVIFVGFVSLLLFGVIAPAVVDPIASVFVEQMPSNNSLLNASDYAAAMRRSVLVWAPLVVLGSGVASAVVYYLRRERRSTRRVR